MDVRQEIVDYIEAHREFFEPFIEDDEPFDKYCSSMRKNARWVRSILSRGRCEHRLTCSGR